MSSFLTNTAHETWLIVLAYFPLGIIGFWRWGVWLIKKGYATTYRPTKGAFDGTVTVVSPVYNENPKVFARALKSWRDNGVNEIVAVIDYTDERCQAIFEEFSKTFPGAKLIVTKKPGKRPALVDGIEIATSDFIALVDSDTNWAPDVKKNALLPFQDPKIGGVSTKQNVWNPQTLAQRLFNAQLNLRYLEELPFMVALGGSVITCFSGRTAFYRRAAVTPLLSQLLHETFWGKPVISGDDKRLTYLVEKSGWKAAYQSNAQVFTPGMAHLSQYFKQRLRWTRNSWRADLRTLTQGWVYKYPRFVWYLIDRVLQPFAQLLSPIAFGVALALGLWIPAAVLFIWWHIGRLIRMWPHLRHSPQDALLIPVFILLNFYNALMKIYALVTLNRQGWITRWNKNRLPGPPPWLRAASAYGTTAVIVAGLTTGMTIHELGARNTDQEIRLITQFRPAREAPEFFTPTLTEFQEYRMQPGDTVEDIAQKFGLTSAKLLSYNAALLPSLNHLEVGLALTIPPTTAPTLPDSSYKSEYKELGPIRTNYIPETNTLEVRGRGQQTTLRRLQSLTSKEFVEQITPGQWRIRANVVLKAGVSLRLTSDEVRWLQLESSPTTKSSLTAEDGQIIIEGVTITSWDSTQNQFDTKLDDGRSYLAVKGNARLDIQNSELAYLGYDDPEQSATQGITYFVSDTERETAVATGKVVSSTFHDNYQGIYLSGTRGVVIEHNSFLHNHVYGIDLFGGSSDIAVTNNRVINSQKHGIVLAQNSDRNIIENNLVIGSGEHGILMYQGSDSNLVANNQLENHRDGIVVQKSTGNIVRNNTLLRQRRGIRITDSSNNLLRDNIITDSEQAGIYLDTSPSETTYGEANTLTGDAKAIRVYVDIL